MFNLLPLCKSTAVQLLYHLATSIIDHYGDEGHQLVKEAVQKFGRNQGRQVKREVEALGLETNLENFILHNGIYQPGSFYLQQNCNDGRISCELHHCPFDDMAIDARKVELGLLLCELDRSMLQGYNPKLALEHSSRFALGSHSCHFVFKVYSA